MTPPPPHASQAPSDEDAALAILTSSVQAAKQAADAAMMALVLYRKTRHGAAQETAGETPPIPRTFHSVTKAAREAAAHAAASDPGFSARLADAVNAGTNAEMHTAAPDIESPPNASEVVS